MKTDNTAPSNGRRARAKDLRSRAQLVALGRDWLRQFEVNACGAMSSDDPEYVHQMRVGLRRLRCLCGVLMDVDAARSAPGQRTVQDELRWIAGVLGNGRDLDVYAQEMLPVVLVAVSKVQATELRRRTARLRATCYAAVRTALASARFRRLPALVEAGFATPTKDTPDPPRDNIVAMVVAGMNRRAVRARRWARQLDQETPEQLHRLRIEVKKLRYLGEMVAPRYPAKAVQGYQNALTQLQSLLGRIQDITSARRLTRALVRGPADSLSAVLATLDAALAESLAALFPKIALAGREFRRSKPFWRRGA